MKPFIPALLVLSSVTLLSSCTVTTAEYAPGYRNVGYQAYYWGNRYYYPVRYRTYYPAPYRYYQYRYYRHYSFPYRYWP
ncbi:hypothetical protein [Legionella impletisoli]|uniref:Lipoprotein n=1 Tax=Legionella impletisoli TaxID=343510 RepID=A0A917K1F4_9GAMM|nr:hypothetical protein [Legionella impletisoli]GGI93464.1 hypothetical protein GCM10007966_22540 [Legionella impletisoli]